MSFYPISLDLAGRHCVVIGGGRVAARKVTGLLACEAQVTVISPELVPELLRRHNEDSIRWLARGYRRGDLQHAFLVIAATDDDETQQLVYEEAAACNILLNVADVPQRCNFFLPATVRRGDLSIAVSTTGKSPALARKLRMELEKRYGAEYRVLVNIMGAIRPVVLAADLEQTANEQLFTQLLHPDLVAWIKSKNWSGMEQHFAEVLKGRVDDDWLQKIRPFYA